MATENTTITATESKTKPNRQQANQAKPQPRVISHPGDVASLVMMQINNVSGKKDELTIAIKALTDTSRQLVRAYTQQTVAIAKLQKQVKELEEKGKGK